MASIRERRGVTSHRSPAIESERRGGRTPFPIAVLIAYLGISFALPQVFTFSFMHVTTPLLAALGLALIGWQQIEWTPTLQAYLWPAGAYTVFVLLSSISHWNGPAIYWAATTVAVWTLFIIPGLAGLFADPSNRRLLIISIGVGIAYYGLVRAFWMATGASLDAHGVITGENGGLLWFLDVNRNDVDQKALLIIPLLWLGTGKDAIWLRRVTSAFAAFWLLTSGGRAGPAFLVLIGLCYIVLTPGVARRVRIAFVAVLLVVIGSLTSNVVGAPIHIGTTRLTDYLTGKRTVADEQRTLLNHRAWDLGWARPFDGQGYGGILGKEDPAFNEGSDAASQAAEVNGGVHNFYLWLFATAGVPGVLAYLALLIVLLAHGVRAREDRDARLATASLIGVLASMFYHTGHQDVPDFAFILFLSVVGIWLLHTRSSRGDATSLATIG